MKKMLILLEKAILLALTQNIYSQTCPKIFIEAKYKIENSQKMDLDLSQEYTLIGMNREAIVEEDKFYEGGNVLGLGDPKCLITKETNLKILPALDYFSGVLKSNDVVILNECHDFPPNRVLLYNILDSLKGKGFNSLFIETLSYVSDDSAYQQSNGIEKLPKYDEKLW